MPPIATKEFRYNSLEANDQFKSIESSKEIKEIKQFSSQPSTRDQMLQSHTTNNWSSSKSFGSKHSVFFPVKSSLPMNDIPQTVSAIRAIHSQERLEQRPNQGITIANPDGNDLGISRSNSINIDYNFKPVIAANMEEIEFKRDNKQTKSSHRLKNRQRPPFQFIEIYPDDEDLVSQISFDGEYDLEYDSKYGHHDKDVKEVAFSRALMEQTDQIIQKAKELTSKRVDNNNMNESDIQTPQNQIQSYRKSKIQGLHRENTHVVQNRQDIVTQECSDLNTRDEKDSQEQLHSEHENVSLSSSIKMENFTCKKSISPPLREISIPNDGVSCVYKPKEVRVPSNYRSKEIDDRISKIKNRGRLRYIKKATTGNENES